MAETIKLPGGYKTIVDECDFFELRRYRWHPHGPSPIYAARGGGKNIITMQKHIMGSRPGCVVDHKNGNALDNRRCNLRFCTPMQNRWNSACRRTSKTGYKGVSVIRSDFIARIQVNGQKIYLGFFNDPKEAAMAYDIAAKKYYGEFARTNF